MLRNLVLVLGDQLNLDSSVFDGFDPAQDAVWMAEVAEESTHIWSSKQRIALFLTAMRHFAQTLREADWPLHYTRIDQADNRGSLAAELHNAIETLAPAAVVLCAPGDFRVWKSITAVVRQAGLLLDVRDDRHFYTTVREFAAYAKGRSTIRLEYFYRVLRQKHGVLMEGDLPAGGQWNFDAENREAFGKAGPGAVPPRSRFVPDGTAQEVIDLVNTRFADHPGTLHSFAWPVTRVEALQSLGTFVQQRLPLFGRYQDALWPGEAWLYHSHISAALNLKLLNPREVVAAAEAAYHAGHAPLPCVEGFIRQILGWREYVRGIYWTQMPGYAQRNALDAHEPLPAWYWTGQTDMACLRDAITQTLAHGYAHHIQRLMVTGLFALLLGVEPQQVHAWYLSVYVDAVEWVELPNTLGMAMYADGVKEGERSVGHGPMASKPYIATGKYIERMGSKQYCASCRYDPALREGERACPYTTLYWDFLARHETLLADNPRMAFPLQNLRRLSDAQRRAVGERAAAIRSGAVGASRGD